jgi:CHAD domain-containing protein
MGSQDADKPLTRRERQRRETASARRYRLDGGGDVAEELRRVAHGRLDRAVEQLRERSPDEPAQAVHEARKDLKKLRSLLRLVRGELGGKRYRAENRRYRDAARLLAGVRDAEVKLETLAALRARYGDRAPAADALQARLEQERDALAADGARLGERVEQAAAAIAGGAPEIDGWSFDGDGFELFEAGLRRAYARGRADMRGVREDPSDEAVHEWRKRAKDLWYQLRLLRDAWPAPLKATAGEASELTDLLGDHHDLSVLAAVAEETAGEEPDADAIAGLARLRQAELLAAALRIGDRLYAEKPARFTARIGRYWKAPRPSGPSDVCLTAIGVDVSVADIDTEEAAMPPRGVKKGTKRARQYEHVKESQLDDGKSEDRAEEIAARTVNKERARSGESRQRSRSSTKDISSGRRGGKRSGRSGPRGRTRDQLYNEARQLGIDGRSKMNKEQLQRAIAGKKS